MEPGALTDRYAAEIQQRLLAQSGKLQVSELRKSAEHLLGRGKLYRPLLVLATCQAASGVAPDQHVGVSCTVELLHTATLVHDDLPCLDDAELRRGLQTVHRVFGEATAILAGDALLNLAFATAVAESSHLDPLQSLGIVGALSTATTAIMEGQVLDLLAEQRSLNQQELAESHRKKTGALIGACCEIGGILAGCSPGTIDGLRQLGTDVGLGFQIRDDLLSLQSTELAAGKTLSTDEEKGKATFPRLLGVEAAEQYTDGILDAARQAIVGLKLADPELLVAFTRLAIKRGR